MTVAVLVRIECDEPGCNEVESWAREGRGGLTVTDGLFWAKDHDWSVVSKGGRYDLRCPVHRKTPIKRHDFIPGEGHYPFSASCATCGKYETAREHRPAKAAA